MINAHPKSVLVNACCIYQFFSIAIGQIVLGFYLQLGTSSSDEWQSRSSRLHKLQKMKEWFNIFEVKIESSVTKVTTLAPWAVRKGGMLFLAFSPELSCIPQRWKDVQSM